MPLRSAPSLSSSTASRATQPSIFEAATSPPSTARSSWEEDEVQPGSNNTSSSGILRKAIFAYVVCAYAQVTHSLVLIFLHLRYRNGPAQLSPTVVLGTSALVSSHSLTAIPAFGAYTLELRGLEFVEDGSAPDGELRGYLEAKLRELMRLDEGLD